MKYIHAIKGGAASFILFALAVYFIPKQEARSGIDLILTVSTFLFAILSGFFIARLNSRYDKIIAFISDEDSYWLTLYRSALLLDEKLAKRTANIIEQYLMSAYNSEVGNHYYKATEPYLDAMYKEIRAFELNNSPKSSSIFQHIIDTLKNIELMRNQSSVLTRERLHWGQWLILFLLGGIIIFCMFFLELNQPFAGLLTVLLSTVLVLVLLIMRDLQNLRLGGYALSIESGQEVLESIGKLRYYPKYLLEDGTVTIPEFVKEYRVGIYIKGKKQKISIVKNIHV